MRSKVAYERFDDIKFAVRLGRSVQDILDRLNPGVPRLYVEELYNYAKEQIFFEDVIKHSEAGRLLYDDGYEISFRGEER